MVTWIFLALALIFWGTVLGWISRYINKINNPYPSAKTIGILRKFLKQIKNKKPEDLIISIGSDKFIRPVGREMIIVSGEVKIFMTEDESRMLTIHLLGLYPELSPSEDLDKEHESV